MTKTALTADSLTGLVNTGSEPETTQSFTKPKDSKTITEQVDHNANTGKYFQYKHSGSIYNIKRELASTSSKQVSVKLEADDYTMLRHCAERSGLNHREIFLEAFDLWIKQNAAKLK